MNADDLAAIEEIRQLKARYCRLMDEKRWDEFGELFVDNATMTSRHEAGELSLEGRAAITDYLRQRLADVPTMHQATLPEISLEGSGSATGVWAAMFVQADRFIGFGRYEERYEKRDGIWRFRSTHLTTHWIQEAGRRLSPGGLMGADAS